MVKKKGEDNSCVASSSECVASLPPSRRNSDEIRRISQPNTSHPPSEVIGAVEAKLLELYSRYADASISGGRLSWRMDASKQRHLALWRIKPGWEAALVGRRIAVTLGSSAVLTVKNRDCAGALCLVEGGTDDTVAAVEAFTKSIGCLELKTSGPAIEEAANLLHDVEARVVPASRLAALGRTRGASLLQRDALLAWDDEPSRCLRRMIHQLAYNTRQPPRADDLIGQVMRFGFDALWDDSSWEEMAGRLCRKYTASWDVKKVAKSPVLPGCFTTVLKIAIPETELRSWARQRLHVEEVEAVLNKVTRNILLNDRPNSIARKYWASAWEKFGKSLGRKMNEDKIGKITDLLVRYGFLTKRRGFKKPSLYGLGPRNLFAKPHLILPAAGMPTNEIEV